MLFWNVFVYVSCFLNSTAPKINISFIVHILYIAENEMRTWKQCYSALKYIAGCYHFLIHLYTSILSFNKFTFSINTFAFSIFFHFIQTLLFSYYFLSYVIVDVCLPVWLGKYSMGHLKSIIKSLTFNVQDHSHT